MSIYLALYRAVNWLREQQDSEQDQCSDCEGWKPAGEFDTCTYCTELGLPVIRICLDCRDDHWHGGEKYHEELALEGGE